MLEGSEISHTLVFVNEAGFTLAQGKRREWNVIAHRATVDVLGQRGGDITMAVF